MVDELEASYFAAENNKSGATSKLESSTIEADTSTEAEDRFLLDAMLEFEASYNPSNTETTSPASCRSAQSVPATPPPESIPETPLSSVPSNQKPATDAESHTPPAWMARWQAAKAVTSPSVKRRLDVSDSDGDTERQVRREMLDEPVLSEEQTEVLNAVLAGENVFFTGCAGTGKSFLLKHIIQQLPRATTYVTAPTGIAACHIGGVTLHNFAGIGLGNHSVDKLVANIRKGEAGKRWRSATALVIDEISMVPADLFDKVSLTVFHALYSSLLVRSSCASCTEQGPALWWNTAGDVWRFLPTSARQHWPPCSSVSAGSSVEAMRDSHV